MTRSLSPEPIEGSQLVICPYELWVYIAPNIFIPGAVQLAFLLTLFSYQGLQLLHLLNLPGTKERIPTNTSYFLPETVPKT